MKWWPLYRRIRKWRDKWLMLAAWKALLYARYDFGSGLDFNIQQLKTWLNFFCPVSEKESTRNDTKIVRSGLGKAINIHLCVYQVHATAPAEPAKMKDWQPHLQASKKIEIGHW
jgi:hypothetical protein